MKILRGKTGMIITTAIGLVANAWAIILQANVIVNLALTTIAGIIVCAIAIWDKYNEEKEAEKEKEINKYNLIYQRYVDERLSLEIHNTTEIKFMRWKLGNEIVSKMIELKIIDESGQKI